MSIQKIKDFFSSLFSTKPEKNSSCPCHSHDFSKGEVNPKGVFQKIDIFSPCDGELVEQKDIPDETFSEGHMGVGIGIDPTGSSVIAFMSGVLKVLFRTKHAYIIQDEKSGVSVMLHLGIETVGIDESKGAFSTNRSQGDVLKAHDDLCEMNLEVISENAKSTVSALLVQNDHMEGKKVVYHIKTGKVKKGDLLMSIVAA